jgi:hypothetical protein
VAARGLVWENRRPPASEWNSSAGAVAKQTMGGDPAAGDGESPPH